jgi:hypothetical protein
MAIKESTHWYDKEGLPAYTLTGANGKERNTTLRDARKLMLYPSVTSVLGVAAKPALENWKIDQALMSALTLPRDPEESLDDFMKRAKWDAKQSSLNAAQRGTEIHADIEMGFVSNVPSVAYTSVRESIDAIAVEEWVAEDSFSHKDGFGGKIDLYGGNYVVDFKTKEGIKGKDPAKLVYDEHGMQLSAYAHGLGIEKPTRVSVFVDREDTSIVLTHVWDDSHDRHLAMFLSLLNYWQLTKQYKPDVGIPMSDWLR